jgi:hypothetical protein
MEIELNWNQFNLLNTIDGVLDRIYTVTPGSRPLEKGKKVRRDVKTDDEQYLYLSETKNSFESELLAWTAFISDPCFFDGELQHSTNSSPEEDHYMNISPYVLGDDFITVIKNPLAPFLASTGRPLPLPKEGQTAFRVSYHALHALSGLRAVLLVLIDSAAACAQDEDYVGLLPAQDSLWALHQMRSWSLDDFVPNAKYWKDWPTAMFLRNPLPKRPSGWTHALDDPLFAGQTGVYYRRLAYFNANRPDSAPFFRAVVGLAQSKRGFAPVPKSFVRRTLMKHRDQLSTPPSTTLMEDGFDPVLARAFIQTVLQTFRAPDVFTHASTHEASTSASVYTTRADGGSRESIRRFFASFIGSGASVGPDSGLSGTQADRDAQSVYMGETPRFLGMYEISPGQVIEERGTIQPTAADWKRATKYWLSHHDTINRIPQRYRVQLDEVRSTLRKHVRVNFDEDLYKFPFARVAAVLEPLKVRTITAMDPILSHVASGLQNALWKHLQTFSAFELIGRPVTTSSLHDLNDRHRAWGRLHPGSTSESDGFVSGDYSAATDGLDIRLSKLFLETLLEKFPEEHRDITPAFRRVLLEQWLLYPDPKVLPVLQKNGQLMGSVLSFPFLCLANMFTYVLMLGGGDRWKTLEILRSYHELRSLPVLINGDDILFRCSKVQYDLWLQKISLVGFVPSLGKNFFHKRFFTINSEPMEFRPRPKTNTEFWGGMSWADMAELPEGFPSYLPETIQDTFLIHGFLNVGLLTGQSKLTGREALKSIPISGWYSKSVLPALNPSQAHRWFLHYHREEIQRQTRHGSETLNIFAHPLLGGLGFPIPEGVEPRFSPFQRRLAHALYLSAHYTYESKESEYDLPALLVIKGAAAGAPLLAHRNKLAKVYLYPVNTPLPPDLEEFEDTTGVSSSPLTVPYAVSSGTDDDPILCRLSGRQIRSLSRQFGRVVDLHPLSEMSQFPFIVVRDTGDWTTRRLYVPELPFVDVPTTSQVFLGELPFPDPPGEESEAIPDPSPLVRQSELDHLTPADSGVDDWDTAPLLRPNFLLSTQEVESVGPFEVPDPNFINRSHAGRKRRRLDRAVPNAARRDQKYG